MSRRPSDSSDARPQPRRIRQNVRDILRWGRPHWRPFVAAFLLMSLMSFMNVGRILVALPLLNSLGLTDLAATPDGKDAGGAKTPAKPPPGDPKDETVANATENAKALSGSWVGQRMQDVVDGLNAVTATWVPEHWMDNVGTHADATARVTLRDEQRTRYATLISTLLLFALVTLIMCAATYGDTYLTQVVQLRIGMDVREAVCRKVLDQPMAFFDEGRRGDIFQRALGDTAGYSRGLSMILGGLRSALQVGSSMLILLALSPLLALVTLIGLPFLLPMKKLSMRTLKRSHKRQEESTRLFEALHQNLSGVRTVKAFGSEERRVGEFRATDEAVTRRALKVQRTKSTSMALVAFINNVLAVALIVGGGYFILRGFLNVGLPELLTFMLILVNMYQPIKRTIRQTNDLLDAMASIERTTQVLELPPGMPDAPDAVPFPGVHDGIAFEHVSFAYLEGEDVLHDVSFEIPYGKTVAIVGPSGGGKSTLCDMLLRFYDPSSGRVLVDGRDLRAFTRTSYLDQTACVTQTPFLFHASLGENIREGSPDATDKQVVAAAEAAHIHEHILKLPRGYDEPAGEGGARMSGGQRQRVTIARALVRDPSVLVLDEATASLDTASEKAVQRALDALRKGRTTLVIAHRLSTIRDADNIVVLDEGRVIEQGTHEALIAADGLYAQLVRLQDVSSRASGAAS